MRRIILLGADRLGAARGDPPLTLRARAADRRPARGTEKATFAGGCFWCMEPPFDELPGVISTTSGYTGGRTKNPDLRGGVRRRHRPRGSRRSGLRSGEDHLRAAARRVLEEHRSDHAEPAVLRRRVTVSFGDLLSQRRAEAPGGSVEEGAGELGPLQAADRDARSSRPRRSTGPRSIIRTTTRRTRSASTSTSTAADAPGGSSELWGTTT